MVTPAASREAVAHLKSVHEVSERRACAVLGADRSSVRYRSRRSDDSEIRARIRDLLRAGLVDRGKLLVGLRALGRHDLVGCEGGRAGLEEG